MLVKLIVVPGIIDKARSEGYDFLFAIHCLEDYARFSSASLAITSIR